MFKESILAVIIIGIVMIIVVPLSTFILDVLLIINISVALLILLTTLYIKEPLEFSSFPSILLITTILRLALNISSTRLILGDNGNAGDVIKTFGSFVIRGDVIVGLIIFLIIIVIQFIVITKGAERVSEVAARFTLDAMPGKQMAIDADLNTGMIDDQQAKKRREDIQSQADFYGSMDGASKFVKGDAIAGIVITFINLVGGIIIGLVDSSMEFEKVIEIYTLATVGDGLVSQIPALLISTAAGIIATRSAAKGNLNVLILGQMLSLYMVLFIGGGTLLMLTFIPGLPKIPLILVGGSFLFLGYKAYIKDQKTTDEDIDELPVQVQEEEHEISDYIFTDPIVLEFGYSLIPLADRSQGGKLLDKIVMIRRQCAVEMGIILPQVRVKDNPALSPNSYEVRIKGIKAGGGELLLDYFLAMNSGEANEEIDGIETTEPAFGMPALWITHDEADKAEMLGYTLIDPVSVISTHLTEIIRENSHQLLGRQEVKELIEALKKRYPALVEELIPNVVSLGALQKVLCSLLEEQIRIKDLPSILEALGDYINTGQNVDELTELVRQRLKREITEKYVFNDKLEVMFISPQVEKKLQNTMPPDEIRVLLENIIEKYRSFQNLGYRPVLLTAPSIRAYLKRLLKQNGSDIDVLSTAEVDSNYELKVIANIEA